MIDMVVDQGFFGIIDRVLDGLQLLGKVDAGRTIFDHLDDHPEVSFGPLEASHDVGMIGVRLAIVGHRVPGPVAREFSDPVGRMDNPGRRIAEFA
jgi:hypothetical protein